MKLYENVLIGNFLYGLGYSIGNALPNKKQLAIINLLQQTPADKELGDMLLEFPGVIRLIEFKNNENKSDKELKRCNQLKIAIGDNEEVRRISKEIHWYVETEPFKETCFNNIKPYINAFDDTDSFYTIESFIAEITSSVINPQSTISSKMLESYLALIARCQGSGEVGTGGLVVSISKDGLRYLQFADIMQLRLQHKDYVLQVEKEFKSIMEKKRNKRRRNSLQLSRGGYSR